MTESGEGRLDALGRLIAEALRHHREQMALLVRLRTRGEDTARARLLLVALGDSLDVMQGHQRRLAAGTMQP